MKNIYIKFKISILTAFIVISGISSIRSQDTIYLFNDSKLTGKVIEITDAEVKYKKTNFLEGPNYVTDKYEVSAIKYSNGFVDSFPEVKPWFRQNKKTVFDTVRVTSTGFGNTTLQSGKMIMPQGGNYVLNGKFYGYRQMGDYLRTTTTDKRIKALTIEAENDRKSRYVGFLAIPLGVIGLVASIAEEEPYYFVCGGVAAGASLVFSISKHKSQKNKIREATKLYNQKF